MNQPTPIRVKVGGSGVVTHRCATCGQPIEGKPMFIHQEGRLVVFHAGCKQEK